MWWKVLRQERAALSFLPAAIVGGEGSCVHRTAGSEGSGRLALAKQLEGQLLHGGGRQAGQEQFQITNQLVAIAIFLFLLVALHAQLYQPINEFTIFHSAGRP